MDTLATIPEYRFETTIDRQSRPFFCSEGRGETRRSGEEKEKENNKHTRARVIKWPELILLFFFSFLRLFLFPRVLFVHPPTLSFRSGAPFFRRPVTSPWRKRIMGAESNCEAGRSCPRIIRSIWIFLFLSLFNSVMQMGGRKGGHLINTRDTHATHDKLIRSAVDGERTKRIRTLRAVVGGGGEVGADKK